MAQIERETFIDSISAAETQMRELRRRIERVAEQLCGETPEADGYSEGPETGGLLGSVESAGHRMQGEIREANEALSRIASRLPDRPGIKGLSIQDAANQYHSQLAGSAMAGRLG